MVAINYTRFDLNRFFRPTIHQLSYAFTRKALTVSYRDFLDVRSSIVTGTVRGKFFVSLRSICDESLELNKRGCFARVFP